MITTNQPEHVVIVGAGIIGLGHAVAALDAGYRVTVLEQDHAAVLASVRNFGHVCASVQAGELGELAQESLPIWLSLAERAGVEARRSGTLAVARTEAEEAVLQELVTERAPAGARLLTGVEVSEQLHLDRSAFKPVHVAGALLPSDVTADPRTAVARIAAWVAARERGAVQFGTTVFGADQTAAHVTVATNRGDIVADRVVIAAGHLVGRLFPELAEQHAVRECVLQMTRVRAPHSMGLGPAVLTGTSMLRYGAFAGPAADALRAEMQANRRDLIEIDANAMFTQQADGTLLVGDSHESFASAPPFLREAWTELLLAEAAHVLGAERLEVIERWQGIYATSAKQDILRATPAPGIDVVSLTTGVGMTVGLGLGARTIASWQ